MFARLTIGSLWSVNTTQFLHSISETHGATLLQPSQYSLSYTEAIPPLIAFLCLGIRRRRLCIQPRQGLYPTSTTGLAKKHESSTALRRCVDGIMSQHYSAGASSEAAMIFSKYWRKSFKIPNCTVSVYAYLRATVHTITKLLDFVKYCITNTNLNRGKNNPKNVKATFTNPTPIAA